MPKNKNDKHLANDVPETDDPKFQALDEDTQAELENAEQQDNLKEAEKDTVKVFLPRKDDESYPSETVTVNGKVHEVLVGQEQEVPQNVANILCDSYGFDVRVDEKEAE